MTTDYNCREMSSLFLFAGHTIQMKHNFFNRFSHFVSSMANRHDTLSRVYSLRGEGRVGSWEERSLSPHSRVPLTDRTGPATGLDRTATSAWKAWATTRRAAGVPRTRAHTVADAAGTCAGTVGGSARPRPPCSGVWACAACWPATRHRPPRTCRRRRWRTLPAMSACEIRCVNDAVVAAAATTATTSASVLRRRDFRHTPVKQKI